MISSPVQPSESDATDVEPSLVSCLLKAKNMQTSSGQVKVRFNLYSIKCAHVRIEITLSRSVSRWAMWQVTLALCRWLLCCSATRIKCDKYKPTLNKGSEKLHTRTVETMHPYSHHPVASKPCTLYPKLKTMFPVPQAQNHVRCTPSSKPCTLYPKLATCTPSPETKHFYQKFDQQVEWPTNV